MSLFLLSFLFIYGGMHVYVYCKARSALHFIPRTAVVLAAFMVFMVFGPVLVHWLKVWGLEFAARGMAYGAYMWMGFLFLFCSGFLAIDCYNILCRLVSLFPKVDLVQFCCHGQDSFLRGDPCSHYNRLLRCFCRPTDSDRKSECCYFQAAGRGGWIYYRAGIGHTPGTHCPPRSP